MLRTTSDDPFAVYLTCELPAGHDDLHTARPHWREAYSLAVDPAEVHRRCTAAGLSLSQEVTIERQADAPPGARAVGPPPASRHGPGAHDDCGCPRCPGW